MRNLSLARYIYRLHRVYTVQCMFILNVALITQIRHRKLSLSYIYQICSKCFML